MFPNYLQKHQGVILTSPDNVYWWPILLKKSVSNSRWISPAIRMPPIASG